MDDIFELLEDLRSSDLIDYDVYVALHDTASVGQTEFAAQAFRDAATRVRTDFANAGQTCGWVGFLDDEAARIEKGE